MVCTRIAAVVIVLGLFGCAKPKLIPNTKVTDNKLNRDILGVVEQYRRAMERLDSVGVLVLVHPTYQDQSGTPQADDDVDYTGLKRLLATRFKRTSKVRYRIEYQEVRVRHNEAEVDAYVDATFVYQEPQAAPRWRRLTDYNRFRLLKDGSNWRFVGGL